MTREELLIEEARSYIGTHEVGGDNCGPMVEVFQKATDGKASREPWCVSFIQYCAKQVDEKFARLFENECRCKNALPQTEHALTLFNKAPKELWIDKPEPGCIVVWQHFTDEGVATINGHGDIVVAERPADKSLMVIGGNTGPSSGEIVREGDGVFLKRRPIAGTKNMRLRGYRRVWKKCDGRCKTQGPSGG